MNKVNEQTKNVSRRTLPDFEEPPVVETVLGVEFAPLQGWNIPHFGLFWNELKSDYPMFEVQPKVGSSVQFSIGVDTRHGMRVASIPPIRCWFHNQSKTRLLQIQDDRFLHNWTKTGPEERYPHYEKIRPFFESEWLRFNRFLEHQGIPVPTVLQCEVTYVNHLERGKGWNSLADLSSVVRCWQVNPNFAFLPAPNAVLLNIRYPIVGEQGELHVTLEPAIRHSDNKEVLQLRLTALGRPSSSDIKEVLRWLDLGREWIVKGFTDFTSPDMHKVWKRSI